MRFVDLRASQEPEPEDTTLILLSSWVGYHLTGIRRVPASLEARVCCRSRHAIGG